MAKCVTQSKMAAKAKWSTTPSCGKTKDPENEVETSWHPRSTPAGHPKTRGTGKRLKYYVLFRTQTICALNSKPKEINSAVAWLADALRCHRALVCLRSGGKIYEHIVAFQAEINDQGLHSNISSLKFRKGPYTLMLHFISDYIVLGS